MVEVHKFYALTNRNNEQTLQWSYNVIALILQCNSFKLPKHVLLTFLGDMTSHVNTLQQFILF